MPTATAVAAQRRWRVTAARPGGVRVLDAGCVDAGDPARCLICDTCKITANGVFADAGRGGNRAVRHAGVAQRPDQLEAGIVGYAELRVAHLRPAVVSQRAPVPLRVAVGYLVAQLLQAVQADFDPVDPGSRFPVQPCSS